MQEGTLIDVLLGVGGLSIVSGLVLGILSLRHRAEGAPRTWWFSPRYWTPWTIVDFYTARGIKVYNTSYACTMLGLAMIAIARVLMGC